MATAASPRGGQLSSSSAAADDDSSHQSLHEKRGKLLEVSNFLTQFQSHLLPSLPSKNNNDVVGPISPHDLKQALQFRHLVTQLQHASEAQRVRQAYGQQQHNNDHPNEEETILLTKKKLGFQRQEDTISALYQQLDKTPSRTKQIHLLLQRLEIWATKLAAQDFLVANGRQLLFDANNSSSNNNSPNKKTSSPNNNNSNSGHCCHSCLLNIPCSKYVAANILPFDGNDEETQRRQQQLTSPASAASDNNSIMVTTPECCSMGLPANKYTYQAYAKFALIVSMYLESNIPQEDLLTSTLEEQQDKLLRKILISPACEYNILHRSRKHPVGVLNPIYKEDYHWSNEDILALLMRAQRNTQSMRHFRLLFEVQRTTTPTAAAVAAQPQQPNDNGNGNNDKYKTTTTTTTTIPLRAVFRGNPNLIKIRVLDTSRFVDLLVEWAVLNQSIYTFPLVQRRILQEFCGSATPSSRKRNRDESGAPLSQLGTSLLLLPKRLRWDDATTAPVDTPEAKRDKIELLREACRRYVLRWFVRRNRRVLLPLVTDENVRGLEIGERVSSDIWNDFSFPEAQVQDAQFELRQYLQELLKEKSNFWASDNTFEKVDKRLDVPTRYHFGNSTAEAPLAHVPVSCRDQALLLCDALKRVWPQQPKLVEEAKKDFIQVYDHFFPREKALDEEDVFQLAASLMEPGSRDVQQVTDLMNSIPSPWSSRKCASCTKEKDDLKKTCANCEKIYHETCASEGKDFSLCDILQKSSLAKGLVQLRIPKSSVRKPDFSSEASPELTWGEHEIIIRRKVLPTGMVSPLLLRIHHTEECNQAFHCLDSDGATIFDLKDLACKKVGEDLMIPLAANFSFKGCLILHAVENGPGYKSGLRPGDIITKVECINSPDPEVQHQHAGKAYDLSTMSMNDRKTILSIPASELKLTVVRSAENVLQMMVDWMMAMKHENRKLFSNALAKERDKIWICNECTRPNQQPSEASQRIAREALFCQTVIRRVGMEAYALPFLGDEHVDEADTFSLRRIDAMMTYIIQRNSGESLGPSSSNPFLQPPSTNEVRDRLPWAGRELEDQPAALLCNSIKVLLCMSPSDIQDGEKQQCGLLHHLLLAFSVWCVGTSKAIDSFTTTGPPDYFQSLRTPWIHPTCQLCFTRECQDRSSTCSSQQCIRSCASSPPSSDGASEDDCMKAAEAMERYSKHASLVGTTFWVLPDDPLVKNVEQVVPVEHANRPVEFIVASYLPASFKGDVVAGREIDSFDRVLEGEGFYHLLPVVSSQQQKYLLDRCRVRDDPGLAVLNEQGVARYCPRAVLDKVRDSVAISTMIHHATAERLFRSQSVSATRVTEVLEGKKVKEPIELSTSLLDALLKGSFSCQVIKSLAAREIDVERDQEQEDSTVYSISGKPFPGRIPVHSPRSTDFRVCPLRILGPNRCRLFYSDILYRGERELVALEALLEPLELSPCNSKTIEGTNLVCTLKPPIKRGWGFEVVQWPNDRNCCRIGRILQKSMAFQAGIRTHDIILAVNGNKLSGFPLHSEILSSFRGFPTIKVQPSMHGCLNDNQISSIMATLQEVDQTIACEVKLNLLRPDVSAGSRNPHQIDAWKHSSPKNCPTTPEIIDLTNDDDNPSPGVNHMQGQERQGLAAAMDASARSRSSLSRKQDHGNTNENRQLQNVQIASVMMPTQINDPNMPARDLTQRNTIDVFRELLEQCRAHRPKLGVSDLYRPAGHGTILTALEVAVFFHAISNQCCIYGHRLLMPRYSIQTVTQQVRHIFLCWTSREASSIPLINASCYKAIVDLDSKRMTCTEFPEVGEPVLKEHIRGEEYEYKLPIKALPIDRNIEKWYEGYARERQTLNQALQVIRDHQQRTVRGPSNALQGMVSTPQRNIVEHNQPQPHTTQVQNHVLGGAQPLYQPNGHHQVPSNFQNNYQTGCHPAASYQVMNAGRSQHHHQHANTGTSVENGATSHSQPHLNFQHPPQRSLENNLDAPQGGSAVRHEIVMNTEPQNVGDEFGLSFHPVQRANSSNVPPERIRGGGDSFGMQREAGGNSEMNLDEGDDRGVMADGIRPLLDVPVGQWDSTPVYADVDMDAPDGSTNIVRVTGFVLFEQLQSENPGTVPETVEVEIHYSSNIGYFGEGLVDIFDTDELFVIGDDPTAEEVRVLSKLRSLNRGPTNSQKMSAVTNSTSLSIQNDRDPAKTSISSPEKDMQTSEVENSATESVFNKDGDKAVDLVNDELTTRNVTAQPARASEDLNETARLEGTAQDNAREEVPQEDQYDLKSPGDREASSPAPVDSPLICSAREFVKQSEQMTVLGSLPDGRKVIWLSNDHRAIYIQSIIHRSLGEKSQKEYTRCLHEARLIEGNPSTPLMASGSLYDCVWGCSVSTSNFRMSRAYPSLEVLHQHYATFHSFSTNHERISLGKLGSFEKISEGTGVVKLGHCLTSAIVARFPLLAEQVDASEPTSSYEGSEQFSSSPTGCLLNFTVTEKILTIFRNLISSPKAQAQNVRELLKCWTRIACLFECDTTGNFRLSDNDFRKAVSIPAVRSANVHCACEEQLLEKKLHCTGNKSCSMCTLPFESYISVKDDETQSNVVSRPQKYGIGCALLSNAAGVRGITVAGQEEESEAKACIPSPLGDAKRMLLHVASLVPESIKLLAENPKVVSSHFTDRLSGYRIFNGGNYTVWKAFVSQIGDTRMLAQALVSLLASINRSKMPSWWSGETGGWSTSQRLMMESDLTALTLHIFVLDAALTELIAEPLRNHATDDGLNAKPRHVMTT